MWRSYYILWIYIISACAGRRTLHPFALPQNASDRASGLATVSKNHGRVISEQTFGNRANSYSDYQNDSKVIAVESAPTFFEKGAEKKDGITNTNGSLTVLPKCEASGIEGQQELAHPRSLKSGTELPSSSPVQQTADKKTHLFLGEQSKVLSQERVRVDVRSRQGLWYWTASCLLVLFAGCASGLTVGLMSLDPVQLKVLETAGTDEQKAGIQALMSVIRKHHLLLVTLLLANSIAMEALPIFLDRLLPSWAAVLLSVTAILLFGEIIPQALCTGPNQLEIAQRFAPFVQVLMAVFFVISWPIAKLLDLLLGDAEPHSYYARAHLKTLIRLHEKDCRRRDNNGRSASDAGSALGADEVVVIEGALDLASKTLEEIMVPMSQVFMLEASTPLTRETFDIILKTGHSRVPVYRGNRNNLQGLLLTKSLLAIDPNDEVLAGDLLVSRRTIFADAKLNLYDLLNEFQKGHSHIAFVTRTPEPFVKALKTGTDVPNNCELLGIVTLEDVIEELIQEEIYDEFDDAQHLQQQQQREHQRAGSITSASATTPFSGEAQALMTLNSRSDIFQRRRSESTRPLCSLRDLPSVIQQISLQPPPNAVPTSISTRSRLMRKEDLAAATQAGFSATLTIPLKREASLVLAGAPAPCSVGMVENSISTGAPVPNSSNQYQRQPSQTEVSMPHALIPVGRYLSYDDSETTRSFPRFAKISRYRRGSPKPPVNHSEVGEELCL